MDLLVIDRIPEHYTVFKTITKSNITNFLNPILKNISMTEEFICSLNVKKAKKLNTYCKKCYMYSSANRLKKE